MERWLRRSDPVVIGIGTGRTMRAVADQLPAMECPQHRLVALVGTTKIDGSASFYDVIIRVSDTVRAPHYPMPLPVIARSVEERELLTSLPSVRNVLAPGRAGRRRPSSASARSARIRRCCRTASSRAEENESLRRAGAVGEITGWAFDGAGRVIARPLNERVASAPLRQPTNRLMIGVAMGASRRAPLRGALLGKLISGLVTDESDGRASAAPLTPIHARSL